MERSKSFTNNFENGTEAKTRFNHETNFKGNVIKESSIFNQNGLNSLKEEVVDIVFTGCDTEIKNEPYFDSETQDIYNKIRCERLHPNKSYKCTECDYVKQEAVNIFVTGSDFVIKNEPYFDSETQGNYENNGCEILYPNTRTRTYQCTECEFSCNSSDTIEKHQNCHRSNSDITPNKLNYTQATATGPKVDIVKTGPLLEIPRFVKRKADDVINVSDSSFSGSESSDSDDCNGSSSGDSDDGEYGFNDSSISKISNKETGATSHHVMKHSGEKPFKCEHCNYATRSQGNLRCHMMKHMCDITFACPKCDYRSVYKCNLQNHMRKLHQEWIKPFFVCSVCGFAATQWMDLKQHTLKHASTFKKKYRCKECNFDTDLDAEFKVHKTVHKMEVNLYSIKTDPMLGIKIIKCSECDYKSSTKMVMECHMMKHTGEKPFKCEICNFATRIQNNLRIHTMRHTGEKPFACPECDYRSINKSTLKCHMRKIHWEQMTAVIATQQGRQEFESHKVLVTHIKHHKSESLNTKFQCLKCERTFHSKDMLENHILSHIKYHKSESLNTKFQCLKCERTFHSKDMLENHILSHWMPLSTDNLECIECNYKCNSKTDLEKHINSHDNINLEDDQFECSLCDYISSSEKDIQEHSLICNAISDSNERTMSFAQ